MSSASRHVPLQAVAPLLCTEYQHWDWDAHVLKHGNENQENGTEPSLSSALRLTYSLASGISSPFLVKGR